MNQCGACRADFTSVVLFDAHRVGRHELDYPEHDEGRHCLTTWEMMGRGWKVNDEGRWFGPVQTEKARKAFARAA